MVRKCGNVVGLQRVPRNCSKVRAARAARYYFDESHSQCVALTLPSSLLNAKSSIMKRRGENGHLEENFRTKGLM